jgi:hypothetical protein
VRSPADLAVYKGIHLRMEAQGVKTTGLILNGDKFTQFAYDAECYRMSGELPYKPQIRYEAVPFDRLLVVSDMMEAAEYAGYLKSDPKASIIVARDGVGRFRGVSAVEGLGEGGKLSRAVASHGPKDYFVVVGEKAFGQGGAAPGSAFRSHRSLPHMGIDRRP